VGSCGGNRLAVLFFRSVLAVFLAAPPAYHAQDAELQSRVARIVEYVQASRKSIQSYTWTEKVESRLNNELKSTKESSCRFDASGKLQKTVTAAPKAADEQGGRKAKKKAAEIRAYMDRVASLVQRYVPPDPARFQEAVRYGRVEVMESNAGDKLNMIFRDFVKKGDEVALVFDPGLNRVLNLNIATYLDSPTDPVMLEAAYAALPDGTGYVSRTELNARTKDVRITTTNFGHRKN
jgi:hypothetical protein